VLNFKWKVNGFLSQFIGKIAMEIKVRDWTRDDLSQIQSYWLAYCRSGNRSDMKLKPDAGLAMKQWLALRFREHSSFGFVAEADSVVAGFLIGRVDDWDSVPPVIETRRIGIIDAVYVTENYRRQGIGTRLIEKAVERIRAEDAVAVETVYDAWNDASSKAWHRAGFAPWMVHAYRLL
jgi:GNAT superfamily N-acetyltransferase